MKQLGILDTAFINLEQANTPQHVGGLGIYDPSTAPDGFVRFKQVIANFERRLDAHPLFRTRLVEVPGGLDRPYWVQDANFDVEFHLRHIALPEPGDWRQLCIQVARLHSRPIDMSRPMWEAYIIEGLDNIPNLPKGSFAVYTKMHHALIDGAGGSSFMALLHDLTPDLQESVVDAGPRVVDTSPSSGELLTKATLNSLKNTVGFLRGTVKNSGELGRYLLDMARDKVPAVDISAPKTLLNRQVGPHRVFDAAEFPLEGFKDIARAGEVKINDVALTIIGGALNRYLESRGETAQGSLAAGIPVNMRTRRGVTDENNQVGSVFCTLHSDIKDPLERMAAVRASSTQAKEAGETNPLVDIVRLPGAVSPFLAKAAAGLWSRNHISQHLPVNISTVITNVPGPNFPLYCAGARMVDYYGLGVLTPGMGLFHTLFSYAGKMTLSVLGDRDIIPDPENYHDMLIASYEELYAAASKLATSNSNKKAVAAKAKISSPKRQRPKAKPKSAAAGSRKKTASTKTKSAKASTAKKPTKAKAGGGTARKASPKANKTKSPQLKVVPKLKSEAS